jgi:hypothetical protein
MDITPSYNISIRALQPRTKQQSELTATLFPTLWICSLHAMALVGVSNIIHNTPLMLRAEYDDRTFFSAALERLQDRMCGYPFSLQPSTDDRIISAH